MKELNDNNFKEEITKEELVLVDFYATWCAPCSMQSEVLKKLSNSRSLKFNIIKVNVDEAPKTSAEYGIESIPTMIVFKGNRAVKRIVGYTEEEELLSLMEEYEA